MKIYSMTATFGKLEHETITLEPRLNIIEAPNEWGKSTWCAFLVNMLYGLETRAKTTKTTLADKERYAPWSGSPMAGRIDLNWNGRDITIERRTRGRLIFGEFRAYETETGIDVPELNGVNCGQTLLGVERSVFIRAGFLKQSDLPVTQDDSLRRRLNNLVTTGDESGTGDKLSQTLRDLKNKCRYNKSGLLPQAESERDQLKNQLSNMHSLKNQAEQIAHQQSQMEAAIAKLENHAARLRYEASQEDARKVEEAETALRQSKERLGVLLETCETLPARDEAQRQLKQAQLLQERQQDLEMEERMLPPLPEKPEVPAWYVGVEAAEADTKKNAALESSKKKNGVILGVAAALAVCLVAAGALVPQLLLYMGVAAALVAAVGAVTCVARTSRIRKELLALYDRYPGVAPDSWLAEARKWADTLSDYEARLSNARNLHNDLNSREKALMEEISTFTGGMSLAGCQTQCAQTLAAWDALGDARQDLLRSEGHVKTLRSMARTAEAPKEPDDLTYTAEQTEFMLSEARLKQRQLHTSMGQCQGQAEALGSEALLRARLDTLNRRIQRLEDTYYALEMAQDALRDASNALQRRFAPRISKRAQALFGKLTGGRYQRLTLGEDLSLSTSAESEDTLRSAQWRSDGTVDQLYLALRLAVAEELTPEAPLILDDAFVRFDDLRLKAAMDILKEESANKQVILFTCQGRERTALNPTDIDSVSQKTENVSEGPTTH